MGVTATAFSRKAKRDAEGACQSWNVTYTLKPVHWTVTSHDRPEAAERDHPRRSCTLFSVNTRNDAKLEHDVSRVGRTERTEPLRRAKTANCDQLPILTASKAQHARAAFSRSARRTTRNFRLTPCSCGRCGASATGATRERGGLQPPGAENQNSRHRTVRRARARETRNQRPGTPRGRRAERLPQGSRAFVARAASAGSKRAIKPREGIVPRCARVFTLLS